MNSHIVLIFSVLLGQCLLIHTEEDVILTSPDPQTEQQVWVIDGVTYENAFGRRSNISQDTQIDDGDYETTASFVVEGGLRVTNNDQNRVTSPGQGVGEEVGVDHGFQDRIGVAALNNGDFGSRLGAIPGSVLFPTETPSSHGFVPSTFVRNRVVNTDAFGFRPMVRPSLVSEVPPLQRTRLSPERQNVAAASRNIASTIVEPSFLFTSQVPNTIPGGSKASTPFLQNDWTPITPLQLQKTTSTSNNVLATDSWVWTSSRRTSILNNRHTVVRGNNGLRIVSAPSRIGTNQVSRVRFTRPVTHNTLRTTRRTVLNNRLTQTVAPSSTSRVEHGFIRPTRVRASNSVYLSVSNSRRVGGNTIVSGQVSESDLQSEETTNTEVDYTAGLPDWDSHRIRGGVQAPNSVTTRSTSKLTTTGQTTRQTTTSRLFRPTTRSSLRPFSRFVLTRSSVAPSPTIVASRTIFDPCSATDDAIRRFCSTYSVTDNNAIPSEAPPRRRPNHTTVVVHVQSQSSVNRQTVRVASATRSITPSSLFQVQPTASFPSTRPSSIVNTESNSEAVSTVVRIVSDVRVVEPTSSTPVIEPSILDSVTQPSAVYATVILGHTTKTVPLHDIEDTSLFPSTTETPSSFVASSATKPSVTTQSSEEATTRVTPSLPGWKKQDSSGDYYNYSYNWTTTYSSVESSSQRVVSPSMTYSTITRASSPKPPEISTPVFTATSSSYSRTYETMVRSSSNVPSWERHQRPSVVDSLVQGSAPPVNIAETTVDSTSSRVSPVYEHRWPTAQTNPELSAASTVQTIATTLSYQPASSFRYPHYTSQSVLADETEETGVAVFDDDTNIAAAFTVPEVTTEFGDLEMSTLFKISTQLSRLIPGRTEEETSPHRFTTTETTTEPWHSSNGTSTSERRPYKQETTPLHRHTTVTLRKTTTVTPDWWKTSATTPFPQTPTTTRRRTTTPSTTTTRRRITTPPTTTTRRRITTPPTTTRRRITTLPTTTTRRRTTTLPTTTTTTTTTTEATTPVRTTTTTQRSTTTTERTTTTTRSPPRTSTTEVTTQKYTPNFPEVETTSAPTLNTSTILPENVSTWYTYYITKRPTAVKPPIPETTAPAPPPVPVYAVAELQMTWVDFCERKQEFRTSVAKLLSVNTNLSVQPHQIVFFNTHDCKKLTRVSRSSTIRVYLFVVDEKGEFDHEATEILAKMWQQYDEHRTPPLLRKVLNVALVYSSGEIEEGGNSGVIAAITISVIAVISFFLLGALLLIVRRKRQRPAFARRCTPVAMDAYSLDSVNMYSSFKRKGKRMSKNSYLNKGFEDPDVPSRPVNFAGLANFSSDEAGLEEEFKLIPVTTTKYEDLPDGAELKNRYANVIPVQESRVVLTPVPGEENSDYINANYVIGPKNSAKYYIATQAPLETTVTDFWRMIWEGQCRVVLMVTKLSENGKSKCAEYLPPEELVDCHRLYGDFKVTLRKREMREKHVVSTIQLKNLEANLWREIHHVWYTEWPDMGVPDDPGSVISFLTEARTFTRDTAAPVVVHCSPGTGRTGTVIACDICIKEYDTDRMVDIPRCVYKIRQDRAGAVQTLQQYSFIYKVLNVYAEKASGTSLDSI